MSKFGENCNSDLRSSMDAKYKKMRESIPRDIIINLLKTNNTEEIIKVTRGNRRNVIYKGIKITMTLEFLLQVRRQGRNIFFFLSVL